MVQQHTFTLNFTVEPSKQLWFQLVFFRNLKSLIIYPEGGTKIVFTAAPESGDTVFVVFLGIAYDVGTLIGTGAITGQTAETSVNDDDLILIYDTSADALEKNDKANFCSCYRFIIRNKKLQAMVQIQLLR